MAEKKKNQRRSAKYERLWQGQVDLKRMIKEVELSYALQEAAKRTHERSKSKKPKPHADDVAVRKRPKKVTKRWF